MSDGFNYLNQEYKDFWSFYPSKTCKKYPFFEGLENVTSVHHCAPRDFGFDIAPCSAWRSGLPIGHEWRIQLSESRIQGLLILLSYQTMQKVPIFQGSWKCHFCLSLRSKRLRIRYCPLFRLTQRPSNRSRVTDSTIWIKNTRTLGPFILQNLQKHAKSTHFSRVLKMSLQSMIAVRETWDSRLPPVPLHAAAFE